jgi:hypothetical protein
MEMSGLKIILAKLPVQLPYDAEDVIKQYLRKRHPAAILISRLCFERTEDFWRALCVSGPDLRISGEQYGHHMALSQAMDHKYWRDEIGFWIQFWYNSTTGEVANKGHVV